ncbi:MAG: type II secretion system F family protein [Planctomycetes bacterium]|nr:type II secretion system F family protein [Planctomycetota bacterium]
MFGRAGAGDVTAFYEGLRVMYSAGLPVTRSLDRITAQFAPGPMQRALADVNNEVKSGHRLSDAMARHPEAFGEMEVHMIRAGETGGTLEESLRSILSYLERRSALKQKVITATLYPVLLLHAAALVPPIKYLFTDDLATYLVHALPLLAGLYGLGAAILVARWVIGSSPVIRRAADAVLQNVPLFGPVVKKAGVARAMRCLAALYKAGVGVYSALELAARACGSAAIEARLVNAVGRIRDGRLLSEALDETRLLHPNMIGVLVAGDEGGQMDECLLKVAQSLEEEVGHSVDRMTKILPVLLFVVIAVFIAMNIIGFYQGYAAAIGGAGGS